VTPLPPDGSVERWAWDYLTTTEPAHKLTPPAIPADLLPAQRWDAPSSPGRPAAWTVSSRAEKSPSPNALRAPEARARLVHTFLHHELQAAELFAWALLTLPDAPAPLRRGWVTVIRDELRHMAMYADYLASHQSFFGQHPVRDWFWSRVPQVSSARGFCAVMSMGLEGGNLDHAARYARWFRDAGDPAGARLQEVVGSEEIAHVRLGVHWFGALGDAGYDAWSASLPAPLTPWMMKGRELARDARARAGMDGDFVSRLAEATLAPREGPAAQRMGS
jgi:uncharacterized ferritin-like protein (DUF455 family)